MSKKTEKTARTRQEKGYIAVEKTGRESTVWLHLGAPRRPVKAKTVSPANP